MTPSPQHRLSHFVLLITEMGKVTDRLKAKTAEVEQLKDGPTHHLEQRVNELSALWLASVQSLKDLEAYRDSLMVLEGHLPLRPFEEFLDDRRHRRHNPTEGP